MDFRCPIYLPRRHRLSFLIARQLHESNCHAGISTVRALLRQRFWVPHSRVLVRRVVHGCAVCRRWLAVAVSQPIANLPRYRVEWSQPFTHVGVDFASPVLLTVSSANHRIVKCYVAVFTCAISRAVHLELTRSLTTDDFLLAFRRFATRRGTPSHLYSDNATNFKKAAKLLINIQCILGSPRIQHYLEDHRITWQFIVAGAPWWGGYWERMVRSIKEPLRQVLGGRTYDIPLFETLLLEVEAVVNTRPLNVIYDNPSDPYAVTPAQLLTGRPLQLLDVGEERRWRSVEDLLHVRQQWFGALQRKWRDSYLAFLRSAHLTIPQEERVWKEGQVVLVTQQFKKRVMWPLARVELPIKGRDGLVRSCRVVLVGGKRMTRPVNLLVPLEEAYMGPAAAARSVTEDGMDGPRLGNESGGNRGE